MSGTRVPLGFAGLSAPLGSHIAFAGRSEEERRSCLLAFVAAGLRNSEKCVAVIPEYPLESWATGLRTFVDDETSLQEGQLMVLTPARFLRDASAESIRSAANTVRRAIETSLDEDWSSVRTCISLTHLYQRGQAMEDLLAADFHLGYLASDQPVTMLCASSVSMLHPKLVETLLKCHPLIVDGSSLVPNKDCLDPASLMESIPQLCRELNDAGALSPPFAVLDFFDDVPVIRTGDEMDIYTAPMFEDLANWMLSLDHRRLVVDLSHTSFVDAISIATLLRIAGALRKRSGQLSIYDPLSPPRKVFQLSGLLDYIPVCADLREAVFATTGQFHKPM